MRRNLDLLALLALALAPAFGCSSSSDGGMGGGPGTFEVGPPGSTDFSSIQEAITAAPAGSTIVVRAGTYSERISLVKSMTRSSTTRPAGRRTRR
jgi:pectin methylesterase-like acyl-CoA thioesterase